MSAVTCHSPSLPVAACLRRWLLMPARRAGVIYAVINSFVLMTVRSQRRFKPVLSEAPRGAARFRRAVPDSQHGRLTIRARVGGPLRDPGLRNGFAHYLRLAVALLRLYWTALISRLTTTPEQVVDAMRTRSSLIRDTPDRDFARALYYQRRLTPPSPSSGPRSPPREPNGQKSAATARGSGFDGRRNAITEQSRITSRRRLRRAGAGQRQFEDVNARNFRFNTRLVAVQPSATT
jgi:hypothetical protein